MSTKPFLVWVRWLDAHATAGTTAYERHELPHRACEIITYGLLLRDDGDGISVAAEEAGGGLYRGVTFIPRALVLECKPVKPVRRKRGDIGGVCERGQEQRRETTV
jgi:hypothetical protein